MRPNAYTPSMMLTVILFLIRWDFVFYEHILGYPSLSYLGLALDFNILGELASVSDPSDHPDEPTALAATSDLASDF